MGSAKIGLLSFLMMTAGTFAGWEPLPPLPEPNGGFACAALAGKIVVLGGTNWKDNTKYWLDEIWVFDPLSRQWESRPQKLPWPLAYSVATVCKGELIIAGGTDSLQARKEIWRLKPSWQLSRVGELKENRALAVGGVFADQLILFGGTPDYSKFDRLHKNGERFDLRSGEGSALSIPGDARFGLAASVVLGQELFVFGGGKHDPDPARQVADLSAAWAMDIPKDKWRSLRPYPSAIRGAAAVKLDPHHILIAGGYGGNPADFTAESFVYDTRRDTYTKTLDLPIAALVGLVADGEFVYCLGGEDKMKHRSDRCARVNAKELLPAIK